jgi:hypothetical protein
VNTHAYPRDMTMWQGIDTPLDDAFVDLSGKYIKKKIFSENFHMNFFDRFNILFQRSGFLAFK